MRRPFSARGNVRLVIDASLCDGHAICALRCPELISLDEWGYAHVEPSPTSSPTIAAAARRAARACPAGAITVIPVTTDAEANL